MNPSLKMSPHFWEPRQLIVLTKEQVSDASVKPFVWIRIAVRHKAREPQHREEMGRVAAFRCPWILRVSQTIVEAVTTERSPLR